MKRILISLLCFASLFVKGQGVPTVSSTGVKGAAISASDSTKVNAKQDSLNWFMPETYGAVGNGTTNDAAAFTAMIAAMPSRGKVNLSSKTYLINTTVTVNKSITFVGNGCGDPALGIPPATKIISSAGGMTVFNVVEDHCTFTDMAFQNTQAGTPTSGAAIAFNGNTRTSAYVYTFLVNNVNVNGFYNGIETTNALHWGITNCQFRDNLRYTIYVACTSLPDGGDSYVTGCNFAARSGGSTAAIYQESSGGLRISNNKFNAGVGKYLRQYWGHFISQTSDLLIFGNSFENYSQNAIQIDGTTAFFDNVSITGNQFAGIGAAGGDIIITGTVNTNLSIAGNVFSKSTDTAIKVTSTNYVNIINTYNNFIKAVYLSSTNNTYVSGHMWSQSTGSALPDAVSALEIAATLSGGSTSTQVGTRFTYTTQGSSATVGQFGMISTLAAGYTGSNVTASISASNNVAGTNSTFSGTSGNTPYLVAGNIGVAAFVNGTTTGNNAGLRALAGGSDKNYAIWASATATKASSINCAVCAFALNASGTSATAGYFSLEDNGTSAPNLGTSAGLVASNGATTNDIFSARDGTTKVFGILDNGAISIAATNTATGTTGAQTINKAAGKVNFAAGASTLVVTNSFVTTASIVTVTVEGTDATATSARITLAAGSFTITLNAAATAETKVAFTVIN